MTQISHKIRLTPNHTAVRYFQRACGVARFAWNWGLATRLAKYKAGIKGSELSGFGLDKQFNAIKHQEFPWTSKVSKWVTQKPFQNLQLAFEAFFRRCKDKSVRQKGYPKLKKKGRSKDSFFIDGSVIKVDGHQVKIPKLGWVRMAQEIRFPGVIKSATISREGDHWFASFSIEVDESWSYPNKCETQASVGIDLGLKTLITLSSGEKLEGPRALQRAARSLRRLSKALSRSKKGSRNRVKAVQRLDRKHQKVAHLRADFTHQLTTSLVKAFRLIGIETLNLRGMASRKGLRLGKSLQDAAFGEIARQLRYKSELSGSTLVEAYRFFPSSKMCHSCGHIYDELALSEREWECTGCGTHHDRDENAAKNLEWFAKMFVALGHKDTLNACGEDVRPPSFQTRRQSSMKQESMKNLEPRVAC